MHTPSTDEVKKTVNDTVQSGKKKMESAQSQMGEYAENAKEAVSDAMSQAQSKIEETPSLFSPSTWIALAFGSMVLSAVTEMRTEKKEPGNFFGLWAPCFLLMGIFAKLQTQGKSRR